MIVVGSINVDLTTRVERLPGPGETVIGGTFARAHGGKGANQAVAAARLGARAVMIGMVGEDDFGRAAVAELEREGVVVDEVRRGPNPTGVAQIMVDARGENLIAVASGANDELTAEMVTESLDRFDGDNAVVLAVLEIPAGAVGAAAAGASQRGWPFVLNPAPARPLPYDLIARCAVLTPNEHEVGGLGLGSPDDLLAAGAGAVVVTRGPRGAELLRSGRPPHRQAAFDVNVMDTTGAGDAFSAALAWSMAGGRELEDGVELAAACGALTTTGAGARGGMPTLPELEEFLAPK